MDPLAQLCRRPSDAEAAFVRELRNASSPAEREALEDHVGNIASERADVATTRNDHAGHEAAVRIGHVATGRLTPTAEHLAVWAAL